MEITDFMLDSMYKALCGFESDLLSHRYSDWSFVSRVSAQYYGPVSLRAIRSYLDDFLDNFVYQLRLHKHDGEPEFRAGIVRLFASGGQCVARVSVYERGMTLCFKTLCSFSVCVGGICLVSPISLECPKPCKTVMSVINFAVPFPGSEVDSSNLASDISRDSKRVIRTAVRRSASTRANV